MTTALLQRPTLILNRNWQPVNVASVARALVLVARDAARVVEVPSLVDQLALNFVLPFSPLLALLAVNRENVNAHPSPIG